ncbi:MAG: glycosyltransferase family 2 protein [Nitrospira sp.]|nr:glycosyltransferase family 2 protein [Nitrospira sp.]
MTIPQAFARPLEDIPHTRPLVSIVIPTYNRAPLLKKAIASALAQEQAGDLFDMEIIIVDDCSSENMSSIAEAFPGVHYIRLSENRGAAGARNVGIKQATGKYVALLDDDDEFLTHKLLVQVPVLEANPDVGVVYGQSVVTGSDVPLLLWPDWAPSGQVFEQFLTRTDDFLHPPTWLVRRELFEAAGWFDEQHRTMEHYDMALRLAALTPWTFLAGGPVARGRFSKKGKWYSNVANGTNEQRLPRIIENALTHLPATPEADRVRQKARAAVCATIAGQRWWNGGVAATRQHLLTALHRAPWLMNEPTVMQWLERVAGELAAASNNPEQAVKIFWHEIEQTIGADQSGPLVKDRRLLGDLLSAAAIALKPGSPRRAWVVAANVLLQDPGTLAQPGRMARLFRKIWQTAPAGSSAAPLHN